MPRYLRVLSSLVLIAMAVGWLLATQSRQTIATGLVYGAMVFGWVLASSQTGKA